MYRARCKEELMLRSMCQPLSDGKRPTQADSGAGFNRPCWGSKGTSAARDRGLDGPARATKWEFAAGSGWMDGKWNYLPSSDKWMSLWEIEWILQPSLVVMGNSRFTFSSSAEACVQICAPAERGEKVTRKKRILTRFFIKTCSELHLACCTRAKLFEKNWSVTVLREDKALFSEIACVV